MIIVLNVTDKIIIKAVQQNPKIKKSAIDKLVGEKFNGERFYELRDFANFGFFRSEAIEYIKENPDLSFKGFIAIKRFKKCKMYKFYDLQKFALKGQKRVSTPNKKGPKQLFVYGTLDFPKNSPSARNAVDSLVSMLGLKIQLIDLADGSTEVRAENRAI